LAVRIRLRRTGAKNTPRYRLIVADGHAKRDGRFIEALGYYDPTAEPAVCEVNEERALYWLSVGAQPSETAKRLLSRAGIIKKFAEQKSKST
jgi:small subunit ribosomal protein S16